MILSMFYTFLVLRNRTIYTMAPRGKQVDIAVRNLIVKLKSEGKSFREIGKIVGKPHATVQSILNKQKIHGTVENLPGRGRKKKLPVQCQRFIVRKIKENPKTSVPKLTDEVSKIINKPLSADTVRRVLKSDGYNGRVARKKPYVSAVNKKKRVAFAKDYVNKPNSFWNQVIFSDESKFNLFGSDGRQIVWRKKNTELQPKNLQATVKHGGGSVMVWGCFSASGVGNLVFIDGIMNQYTYIDILEHNLQISADKMGLSMNFCFQQDNDPKHTARSVQAWLASNVPNQLKTPPQSPDLNPIENLWSELERRIRKHTISNKNDLKNALQIEWNQIDTQTTQKHVNSMHKRLNAVLISKGNATKY